MPAGGKQAGSSPTASHKYAACFRAAAQDAARRRWRLFSEI
jgi:hypothetical protein